jgi:hypothetical protein
MSKTRAGVVFLVLLGTLIYRMYGWRIPWIKIDAYVRAKRGAVRCGDVTNHGGDDVEGAVNCALSAHKSRRPFVIIFTVSGIDERISSAVVGDSDGNAVEILYMEGMFRKRDTLLRHVCSIPARLELERSSPYEIPRVHCAPWPPPDLEKDYIFW